jgi:hypothetical protein
MGGYDSSPFPVEGDNHQYNQFSNRRDGPTSGVGPTGMMSGFAGSGVPAASMPQPLIPGGGGDWFSQSGIAQAVTSAALSAAINNSGDPSRMIGGLAANVEKTSQTWFQSWLGVFKGYFNLTHSYVRWKLLYVLFPFIPNANAIVSRTVSREVPQQADDDNGGGMGLRLMPGRRPDLYIPLMGYITFILAYGFSRGDSFHPDDLYNVASLAGVLGILEVLAIKGAAYILSIPTLSFIDIVAICGYKFVNLCLSVMGLILLGPVASRAVWLFLWIWAASMAGLTVQKGLLSAISYNSSVSQYMGTGTGNMEKLLAIVAGGGQVFWCWLLMPAFAALETAKDPVYSPPGPRKPQRVFNGQYVESTGGG